MDINGFNPIHLISSNFDMNRPAAQPPQPQAGGASQYGDAVLIDISPEALALAQSSGPIHSTLSEEATEKLEKLFAKIDKIFEQAEGEPLSEKQQSQLEKLDKKIAKLLEENLQTSDPLRGLDKAAKKELDGLYDEMSKIIEGAGDKPLSESDLEKLQGIEKRIDEIFNKKETETASLSELSEEASKELDDLFAKLDEMFKKNANGSFNKDQQTQLQALDNKLIEMLSGVS